VCPCKEHIYTQSKYFCKLLKKLARYGEKKRKELFSSCDPCFVRYLTRCASGLLNAHIKLPHKGYKSLKGHKEFLVKLANSDVGIKTKRRLLSTHTGGFWPVLASIAANALLSYGVNKIIGG
jgi:hypothetical protein